MIALVILLLVSLALMQTALVSIDSNTRTLIRDEAIRIADQRVSDLRSLPFDDAFLVATVAPAIPAPPSTACPAGNDTVIDPISGLAQGSVVRDFRNFQITYQLYKTIVNLDLDNKDLTVGVCWRWKNERFQHNVNTLVRNR